MREQTLDRRSSVQSRIAGRVALSSQIIVLHHFRHGGRGLLAQRRQEGGIFFFGTLARAAADAVDATVVIVVHPRGIPADSLRSVVPVVIAIRPADAAEGTANTWAARTTTAMVVAEIVTAVVLPHSFVGGVSLSRPAPETAHHKDGEGGRDAHHDEGDPRLGQRRHSSSRLANRVHRRRTGGGRCILPARNAEGNVSSDERGVDVRSIGAR
mmetsp:Transcript_32879/g.60640  ORF Transcript_32879/g.60640 Transcript_32879/m.60640 type:complete len:212 (-) Transcript_32879:5-640(-)